MMNSGPQFSLFSGNDSCKGQVSAVTARESRAQDHIKQAFVHQEWQNRSGQWGSQGFPAKDGLHPQQEHPCHSICTPLPRSKPICAPDQAGATGMGSSLALLCISKIMHTQADAVATQGAQPTHSQWHDQSLRAGKAWHGGEGV
eukprot:1161603-Pelagomonas_calceolata.AAC.7